MADQIEAAFGNQHALELLVKSIGYKSAAIKDAAGLVVGYEPIAKLNETILMLVVLGLAGLGRTIQYIPWPVIEGFTVGIAIIIGLQQVPVLELLTF